MLTRRAARLAAERAAAATCLQRAMRAWPRDPISMDLVRRRFVLYRNHHLFIFDAHTFAEWVKASGDLRDPLTRQPLANHERMRLERLSGIALPVQELTEFYEHETRRRELVNHFCNEIVEATVFPLEAILNLYRVVRSMDELRTVCRTLEPHGIYLVPR